MSSHEIAYLARIRKDQAIRVPDDVWNLGFKAKKLVKVTLAVLDPLEESEAQEKDCEEIANQKGKK